MHLAAYILPLLPLTQALQLRVRQYSCTQINEVSCDDNCMPPDAVCCSDGSGTYCPAGNKCVPDGCCPEGETCMGGGGTQTLEPSFTTSAELSFTDSPSATSTGGDSFPIPSATSSEGGSFTPLDPSYTVPPLPVPTGKEGVKGAAVPLALGSSYNLQLGALGLIAAVHAVQV